MGLRESWKKLLSCGLSKQTGITVSFQTWAKKKKNHALCVIHEHKQSIDSRRIKGRNMRIRKAEINMA